MPTLTCDHCESEIDVALDPRCVVYDPSGATEVICKKCKELMWEQMCEAYRIKRGWQA